MICLMLERAHRLGCSSRQLRTALSPLLSLPASGTWHLYSTERHNSNQAWHGQPVVKRAHPVFLVYPLFITKFSFWQQFEYNLKKVKNCGVALLVALIPQSSTKSENPLSYAYGQTFLFSYLFLEYGMSGFCWCDSSWAGIAGYAGHVAQPRIKPRTKIDAARNANN